MCNFSGRRADCHNGHQCTCSSGQTGVCNDQGHCDCGNNGYMIKHIIFNKQYMITSAYRKYFFHGNVYMKQLDVQFSFKKSFPSPFILLRKVFFFSVKTVKGNWIVVRWMNYLAWGTSSSLAKYPIRITPLIKTAYMMCFAISGHQNKLY